MRYRERQEWIKKLDDARLHLGVGEHPDAELLGPKATLGLALIVFRYLLDTDPEVIRRAFASYDRMFPRGEGGPQP